MPDAVPILFSDRGCPFAQRVLALVAHLGCPLERRESLVGDKPAGLERYAPSGAIPLLVHGDLVLTESRVMIEHLAEHYGFAGAYPAALGPRTLHRHAMAVADRVLAPHLQGAGAPQDAARLDDALSAIEVATETGPLQPCLLALHLAPLWRAFRIWHPTGAVTRAIEGRPGLAGWLDAAGTLDCVLHNAPAPADLAADLARARRAGLLSATQPPS